MIPNHPRSIRKQRLSRPPGIKSQPLPFAHLRCDNDKVPRRLSRRARDRTRCGRWRPPNDQHGAVFAILTAATQWPRRTSLGKLLDLLIVQPKRGPADSSFTQTPGPSEVIGSSCLFSGFAPQFRPNIDADSIWEPNAEQPFQTIPCSVVVATPQPPRFCHSPLLPSREGKNEPIGINERRQRRNPQNQRIFILWEGTWV
jgi:hypothetical protein